MSLNQKLALPVIVAALPLIIICGLLEGLVRIGIDTFQQWRKL